MGGASVLGYIFYILMFIGIPISIGIISHLKKKHDKRGLDELKEELNKKNNE